MKNTTKIIHDPARTSAIIPGDFLGTRLIFATALAAGCGLAVGCEGIVEQPEPQDQPEIQAPKSTVVAAGGLAETGSSPHGLSTNGMTLNGMTLNGMTLNGMTLNGMTLNGMTLNGMTLNGMTLNGMALNGMTLNGMTLNGMTMNGMTLNGLMLNGMTLNGMTLNGMTLNGLTFNGISLGGLRINGLNLNGLELSRVSLSGIGLNGLRLNALSLNGIKLHTAKVDGAPLSGTQMSSLKLALSYVAKCALSSGQCVTVTDVDGVSTYSMCGESGLDSTWNTDLQTSVSNEAAVTQCVIDIADNDPAYPANTVTHTNREAAITKDFFNHAVYCALPAGTCVTTTDIDSSTYQSCGSQGLDPAWQTGPATQGTVSEQVASCVMSQASAHGDSWSDNRERLKTVFKYAAECALRSDQTMTATDWNGNTLVWQGALGLADWWHNAPLSPAPSPKAATAGEELVSACLMARTNAFGKTVAVSLRARPELAPTTTEAAQYARHEGAFMGNLFSATPTAKACSSAGGGWIWDAQTGAAMTGGRQCADGTTCGFEYVGACTSVCTVKPGVNGETLFDNCAGNSNVVNTFLYSETSFTVDEQNSVYTPVAGSENDAPMVATADFNNDGNLDLAIENNYTSVLVRLGDGNGGLSAEVAYSLGTSTRVRAVVAKDLNKDGRIDLVTANQTSLSVLLGAGDGTFGAATTYPVTNAAGLLASVAVADFNGDGKQDLATNLTSGLGVFLGTGTGTFGAQSTFTGGSAAHSLVAGDFNGDGKVDLASANSNGASLFVTWGLGTGAFGATATVSVGTTNARPRSITVGDFNSDGKADMAVAVAVDNTVKVLLGQANGTFVNQSYAIAGSGDMKFATVAHLNGTGPRDLLVGRGSSIVVMTGNANGTFTLANTINVGQPVSYVVVGHYNGDPTWRLDLIASADAGGLVQMNGTEPQ